MNLCRDCNFCSSDDICLHESARDPSGTHPNLTTAENRSYVDAQGRFCGREGRFWQAKDLVWPSAPVEG